MKVAVVIPKYGLVGGAESFAYEVTERLAEHRELEIHLFANQWRRGKAPVHYHKVPIIAFPRFLRPVSFAYFADKKIQAHHFDLIHSHDRIFRMDILTMHGVPHERWVKEARSKPLSLFDRSMVWIEKRGLGGSQVPTILPVSALVKDELLMQYRLSEKKIHVIHPGVSMERFNALEKDACKREIRDRHGLSIEDVLVLFVSMNFELKRLDLVLEGLASVVNQSNGDSRLKLLVVGKGNMEKYRRLAIEMGIGNRVIFAGVTREIEKYYLASDIFAMPSKFDTFGIAVLEAMMAGLPVIITQRVGARDLVESGLQGFVLGAHPTAVEFGEKLAYLTLSANRQKMGENARKVAAKYNWDGVADKVLAEYRKLAY